MLETYSPEIQVLYSDVHYQFQKLKRGTCPTARTQFTYY